MSKIRFLNLKKETDNKEKKHKNVFGIIFKIIRISLLLFLAILIVLVITGAIYTKIEIHHPYNSDNQERAFLLEKGASLSEIAQKLQNEKYIRNKWVFIVYVTYKKKTSELKAGEYALKGNMTIAQIANKFVLGNVIRYKITIKEGWNLKQIGEYLEEQNLIFKDTFLAEIKKIAQDFLKNKEKRTYNFLDDEVLKSNFEGYLFPDTYFLSSKPTTSEIIFKMLANFNSKLTPDLKTEIKNQKKNLFEVITSASILEKEAKTLDDKKVISGIFYKRLAFKKPLESCATVQYILGTNKPQLSFADTRVDSPYNTYIHQGLPPGPIANPSLDSIIAAIYPTDTDWWYFLSTDEGKIIFNKTLEAHNIDKRKYLDKNLP